VTASDSTQRVPFSRTLRRVSRSMRFPMALSDIPKTPDASSAVTRLGPDAVDRVVTPV
jgi:hypothetical protein